MAGRPYATWTVGGDYTARGGAYLNLQWAHGLFFERGEENLHDYLLARYERRLNRDAVTLALEAAAEVAEWSEVSKEWGYGFFPTVTYRPADNTEVSLGAFSVGGRGQSVFRRWSGADQVYARVRVEF